MPKKSKYNYYVFDVTKIPEMASFIIYGLLKKQLTAEQKDEIFKKISVYNVLISQEERGFEGNYGREIAHIAENYQIDEEIIETESPKFSNTSEKGFYIQFADTMNPALKVFKSGLNELLKVMKEKRQEIRFNNAAEKNYYDLMQLMIEDAANEKSWRDNIEADVQYEYAWNTQIKFGFTAARPGLASEVDADNPPFKASINESNDAKTLKLIDETGIPAAVSGGLRTIKKLEDHIKKGDVSRYELICEYEAQQARLEKALSLDEETYDKLKEAGALQNPLEEYTNGDRGYKYVLDDVIAKKDLLKAGWPASDIQELAKFRRLLGMVEARKVVEAESVDGEINNLTNDIANAANMPEGNDNEKKAKKDRQDYLNNRKAMLESKKEQIEEARVLAEEMKEVWNATIEDTGMTEIGRLNKLNNISEFLDKAKNNTIFAGAEHIKDRVMGMVYKELKPVDKTILTHDISGFLRDLESVDPALVSSSKQFSAFKRSLKELSRLEKHLKFDDVNDNQKVYEYNVKVREVAEKAALYLRYKSYQYNGPDKDSHKRSELELKRVSTVDAILNGLKKLKVPNSDELIIEDCNKYRPFVPNKIPGFLGEYADAPKTDEFDKVMERYTGRGVINGTVDEMREAFSKALPCFTLKGRKGAVYNKANVDKEYKQLQIEFEFDRMTEDELREGLQNPLTLKNAYSKQIIKTYAPKDEYSYGRLIEDMRQLYPRLGRKNDDDYMKVYGLIEKLAHLPEKLDGVDNNKLFQYVGLLNHELFRMVSKRILNDPDTIDLTDKLGIITLKAIDENCDEMQGVNNRLFAEVLKQRGAKKDGKGNYILTDKHYFDFDKYDRVEFDRFVNKEVLHELNPALLKKQYEKVRVSAAQVRNNLLADKAENQKAEKSRPKEAPVKGHKKDKSNSRPRRNSMG